MPWQTPTLSEVRGLVRDSIHGSLPGSDATIPNSVLRVISDVQGALCFLTLEYVDWLSLQLMPDTAETVWLDRHGDIWLVNADGTVGRKQATLAQGTVNVTGQATSIVPDGAQLSYGGGATSYEVTAETVLGPGSTPVPVRAIDPGSAGNLLAGGSLSFVVPPPGVDSLATVVEMTGGTDTETDDELRARVLQRIRQPPMGGDLQDYVRWALAVPGVTRAWASQEMGIGTITVRFMMDDLRADNDGFPLPSDIDSVQTYLNTVRPVTVKDMFVVAPIPYPCNVQISNLDLDTAATHGAIELSLEQMFIVQQAPGQTIYAAWKSAAILNAAGVVSFDLDNTADDVMPAPGYMGVLGDITYA